MKNNMQLVQLGHWGGASVSLSSGPVQIGGLKITLHGLIIDPEVTDYWSAVDEDGNEGIITREEREEHSYKYCEDVECYAINPEHCETFDVYFFDSDLWTAVRGYRKYYVYGPYLKDDSNYTTCDYSGEWIEEGYSVYIEDTGQNVHEGYSHCYFQHSDGLYYSYEEEINDNAHICDYHCSPDPIHLSAEPAQFWVGFEVEKNSFDGESCEGDYVGEYDLFKGFERDGSCGVEAITNILALDSVGSRNEGYIFDLFRRAADILNEEDVDESCGCHTNVSAEGIDPYDLFDMLRPYMGLFYALYRGRLTNTYCQNDKEMIHKGMGYAVVRVKRRCVEIRLPNRLQSVEQLKNRYRITYLLLHFACNHEGTRDNFYTFLNECRPILELMYRGNSNKVNNIIDLAKDFQMYINSGVIKAQISSFINN